MDQSLIDKTSFVDNMANEKFVRVITRAVKIMKRLIHFVLMWIGTCGYKLKLKNKNDIEKVVLFFLPEMSIDLYREMLIKLAEDVKDDGYAPVFFGCNGSLRNCMLIDRLSKNTPVVKNKLICCNCAVGGKVAVLNNGFNYLKYSRAKKINVSFSGNGLEERLRYSHNGIPVGRLAYYDLSIIFKRDRARHDLSDEEVSYYDRVIFDGVSLIDFLDENRMARLAVAMVAIDEYSLANIAREWARKNNISAFRAGFSYHFNADPQFVTLSNDKTRAYEKSKREKAWMVWRNIPLPPAIIEEIATDLIFRMSGTGGHIFSSNYSGDLEKFISHYGVQVNVKTIVVFTSANDEIDALLELSRAFGESFEVKDAFESQIDWLEYIIDYAKKHDVQVIIKMHPRLSSSHRDKGSAEDLHVYKKLSTLAPENVFFIWPEDVVSAYDILQLADICLTSWGTMGLEAAKLGVPVVTGLTKITFATPNFPLFLKAENVDDFREMITLPLDAVHINDITEAFRWHHLLHMSGSIIVRGEREINLYEEPFDVGFSEVFQGVNIADEKCGFLLKQMEIDKERVVCNELMAMKSAIDKIVNFFDKNENSDCQHSKLLARLRLVTKTCDGNGGIDECNFDQK